MLSTSLILSVLLSLAMASNVTFYTDTFCQTVLSTIPFGQTGTCYQLNSTTLPQSVRFHLQDFVSAYITARAYTADDCTVPCGGFSVQVENASPNPAFPIANDQCVSTPNGETFASYDFGAFR